MRSRLALTIATLLLTTVSASAQPVLLKTTGWGSLSGKVTLEGGMPTIVNLAADMAKHTDKDCCLAGPANQTLSPRWVIDPKTKGIANVAVWIKPPKGSYFPIHDDDKVRKDTVVVDQPFCAFVPHAVALFPHYYDGAKQVRTGQKFLVKNSAKVPHNVRGTTNRLAGNNPFNINMPSGAELEFSFKAQTLPITLQCDFHKWMDAYVFVYDHPYFALTKQDGSFTIPRVPAGAEVTIMAWHEVVVLNALAIEGKQITLKAGENTFNFSIKAPQ